MSSPQRGNNSSRPGNNNNNSNRNNDKRKQKSTKKPRPSGFQGNATSSDNIYRKVITATGNQNTQYVALKTALEVYAGRQGHQLWSQSIREMQLVPDSEFDIPRVDKEEYGEYSKEGNSVSMMPEHRMTMTMPCIVSMLIQKKDLSTNMHTRTVAGTYMR